LLFDASASKILIAVTGEDTVAHHGVLATIVIIIDRDNQRVVIVDGLSQFVCCQVIKIERDRAHFDGLPQAGVEAELLHVVALIRCEKPNKNGDCSGNDVKSFTYISGTLFEFLRSVTQVFTRMNALVNVSTLNSNCSL
jgi:hypothetical protein